MGITHGGNIFAVARQHGWDWRDVLDFSASINPLGPAPGVAAAVREATDRIVHYPERDSPELVSALSQRWAVEEGCIIAGNGATELIFFLARVLRAKPIFLALPVFSEFHRAFPQATTADLNDPATWPHEGLLVLTRPANPTGRTLPLSDIERWLTTTKATVIVDESFLDFSSAPSAASLIDRYQNVIVLRSLTKFYALPGLRIGGLIASSATVARWQNEREPWQVNVLAERAALAALRDVVHADRSRAFVAAERGWLASQISAMPGASPQPSDANFIHVLLSTPAVELCTHLLQSKILVRDCGDSVRIAVRTRRENEQLLTAWKDFKCV